MEKGFELLTVPMAKFAGHQLAYQRRASAGILSPIVTYWVSLGAGETQGADLGRVTAAASLGQAIGSAAGGLAPDRRISADRRR
jgi:predicted MFS family arabinose efflux permease